MDSAATEPSPHLGQRFTANAHAALLGSSMPITPRRAELEARMSAAALRYVDLTGTPVFVFPIPNTSPQMFVAAGDLEGMVRLLTGSSG